MKKPINKLALNTCTAAILLALAACGSSDGGITGTGDPTIVAPTETGDTQTQVPSDNTGSENTGNTGSDTETTTPMGQTPTTNGLSPGSISGDLNTATPEFMWDATEDADSYQLVITDPALNQITYNAGTDSCAGTSCSATPTVAFHNSSLNWRIDSLSAGQVTQSSAVGSYSTPISLDLTPVTSNPSVCAVWPSISYDNYIVLDNIWNNGQVFSDQWSQSIGASQASDGKVTTSWNYNWLAETDGDRTAVKAYPEIIYGNKLGTHVSGSKEQTGLPEVVSNLPEFSVDFAYSETFNGSVERNVALESFFHDSCEITGPCDLTNNTRYEMMVWVNNPESNLPGDLAATGVMIDNRLWDVYIKPRSDKKYIAFTAHTPITEGTLQWNRFVEWTMEWTAANAEALSINALTPNLCMAAIEMGTELWWGEGTFTLNNFNVTKN